MTEHSRGTRSQVLACLSVLWILTAYRLLTVPTVPNPDVPHTTLDPRIRAAFWLIPGVVALVAVWWRRLDVWAWTLLIIPALERTISYLVSATGMFGYGPLASSWGGVSIYATIGVLINRCAKGLDRPPTLPAPPAPPLGKP